MTAVLVRSNSRSAGRHVGRDHDVVVGPDLLRRRAGLALVLGVRVGVQEGDDEDLAALVAQGARSRLDPGHVNRNEHAALGADTLRHLETIPPRDERLELGPEPVGSAAGLAAAARGHRGTPRW
jgi:hypothetical protein